MLQAVLLSAAMSSSYAFVAPVRPALNAAAAWGSSGMRAPTSSPVSTFVKARALVSRSKAAAAAHGLHMVATGIDKGMFTTSSPEDRRVVPEFRDGKAYFKVSPPHSSRRRYAIQVVPIGLWFAQIHTS